MGEREGRLEIVSAKLLWCDAISAMPQSQERYNGEEKDHNIQTVGHRHPLSLTNTQAHTHTHPDTHTHTQNHVQTQALQALKPLDNLECTDI